MSKTAQRQDSLCRKCNQPVQAAKDESGKLVITCGCDERSIRVSRATPGSWEL